MASRGMQTWFARSERGRIQGIVHFFSRFAVAITPLVSGHILLAFGWRWIFYIFGSIGVLWAVVFFTIYRDHPEDHPGVNQAELAQIRGRNTDGTMKPLDRTRPADSVETHCRIAEHVVHRDRLWVFLLRV